MDEWYSYFCFRFARHQVIWAIEHRVLFDEGRWPPEPSEYETDEEEPVSKEWVKVIRKSSYVDLTGPRQFKPDAYFIKPKVIWADINKRLELTGTDGKLLVEEIDRMEKPDYESLTHFESRNALNYISLENFKKRPPYSQWKRRRRYYKKTGR